MKIILRLVSMIAVVALLLNGVGPKITSASEVKTQAVHNQLESGLELVYEDGQVETQAISTVMIWFGGAVVGFVADGAVTYYTGYGISYWVAKGFGDITNKLSSYSRSLSNGSTIVISNSGSLSSCASFPCAIANNILDEK